MKKRVKIIAALITTLCVAAVAVSFAASGPAEKLKTLLLNSVEKRIGRKIAAGEFGGNPFTGFSVREVKVSGAGSKEPSVLNLFSMKLGFSLMDFIFERKIHLKSLDLIRPQMRLVIFEDGTNNLSDIMKRIVSAPESEREFPKIELDEITVRDGSLRIRVYRAGQKPLDLTVRSIEFKLRPDAEGNFSRGVFSAKASLEKIVAKATGQLRLDKETVTMRWETTPFSAVEASRIFTKKDEFAKGLKLEGDVTPSGTFKFMRGAAYADSKAKLRGIKVMGFPIGDGEARVDFASDTALFEGKLSYGKSSSRVKGEFKTGKTRRLTADAEVKGFSTPALMKLLSPDFPEIVKGTVSAKAHIAGKLPGDELVEFEGMLIDGATVVSARGSAFLAKTTRIETDISVKGMPLNETLLEIYPALAKTLSGTVGGNAHISGDLAVVESLTVSGDARLSNGAVVYPTPSFKGAKNAKATLPVKELTTRFMYKNLEATVSDMKAAGTGYSATGSGSVKLMKNKKTSKIEGVELFDAKASLNAPNAKKLLETNPHLEGFLSGKLAANAHATGAPAKNKLVHFDGTLAIGPATLSTKGTARLEKTMFLDADVAIKNFSQIETLRKFSPALADAVSGTFGGNARISGNPAVIESITAKGNARLSNGYIVYPSPSFRGTKNAKAKLPIKELSANFQYKNLSISASDMRASGPGYSATGAGSMKLLKNKQTKSVAGVEWFEAKASVNAPEVARVLETNPHLGAFVTGKLVASAGMRGNPKALDTLEGSMDARLTGGRVTNPYDSGARNLPLNANLSHFDFTEISGKFDVSKSAVKTDNFAMQSSVLNAAAKGSLGFDGALKVHADADVSGGMVAQINDFKSILPKLGDLNDIERIKTSCEIGGTIQKPKIHWNAQDVLAREAKKIVKKKAMKMLEDSLVKPEDKNAGKSVEDVVKDKLKKKFKGLF